DNSPSHRSARIRSRVSSAAARRMPSVRSRDGGVNWTTQGLAARYKDIFISVLAPPCKGEPAAAPEGIGRRRRQSAEGRLVETAKLARVEGRALSAKDADGVEPDHQVFVHRPL